VEPADEPGARGDVDRHGGSPAGDLASTLPSSSVKVRALSLLAIVNSVADTEIVEGRTRSPDHDRVPTAAAATAAAGLATASSSPPQAASTTDRDEQTGDQPTHLDLAIPTSSWLADGQRTEGG
jgi:hypothetical protein